MKNYNSRTPTRYDPGYRVQEVNHRTSSWIPVLAILSLTSLIMGVRAIYEYHQEDGQGTIQGNIFDTNKDGIVDYSEWSTHYPDLAEQLESRRARNENNLENNVGIIGSKN